jgi:hypothetical protein
MTSDTKVLNKHLVDGTIASNVKGRASTTHATAQSSSRLKTTFTNHPQSDICRSDYAVAEHQ